MTLSPEDFDRARAAFARELRTEARRALYWIGTLVFFFGLDVFMVAYNIITPGDALWLQTVVVMANIGGAVYAWHVVMNLRRIRAEWLNMLEQLR